MTVLDRQMSTSVMRRCRILLILSVCLLLLSSGASRPAFAQQALPQPQHPQGAVAPPSAADILSLGPPPRGAALATPFTTPVANQQLAAAQAQVQEAQAGCAQADVYQSYVQGLENTQNTTDPGIVQTLQTLANDTSDPNLQSALLDAIGQPNPINDELQQKLQNMAGVNESICQTRKANAQAALAQARAQQATGVQGQAANGASFPSSNVQGGYQAGYQAGLAAAQAQAGGSGAGASNASTPAAAQPNALPDAPCPSAAASNLPSLNPPWGPWAALGDTGLMFDVSRVNGTTATWRFLNAGSNMITSMQFNYTYIDAKSGQRTTQSDILPFPLAPGQTVGGFAAYTANTRGNVEISVTQMSCH
jgi:hypothetical protein